MALAQDLDKSTKAIEKAIRAQRSPTVRTAAFGFGGIGAILGALREFCKNWKKIKPALNKAIAFLKKNGQKELAKILEKIVKFFDALSKVCRFIP